MICKTMLGNLIYNLIENGVSKKGITKQNAEIKIRVNLIKKNKRWIIDDIEESEILVTKEGLWISYEDDLSEYMGVKNDTRS